MDFSKFTDRSRKVFQLAVQEAMRKRPDCPVVNSYDLLIGLVKEGSGIASTLLTERGVDLRALRELEEKHPSTELEEVLLDVKGRRTHAVNETIWRAIAEAEKLGVNYVGTEHILLAICIQFSVSAREILRQLGTNPVRLEKNVLQLIVPKTEAPVAEWVSGMQTGAPAMQFAVPLNFNEFPTVRDQFAIAAMGMIQNTPFVNARILNNEEFAEIADKCYQIAEAMMRARARASIVPNQEKVANDPR